MAISTHVVVRKVIFLLSASFILFGGVRTLLPKVVFQPSSEKVGTPAVLGLEYENVFLKTENGVLLNGWFVPAPNARGTLLFFHGNAGNITGRLDSIKIFNDLGLSVFIIDYRGYGASTGRPSISGVHQDALTAWRWLVEEKKQSPEEIVLFGRSLGGAVAMELAQKVTPAALIFESSFASIADMVRVPMLVPLARLLTGNPWDSERSARNTRIPALFIHSPEDEIVPYEQGRRVYEAYAGEKRFQEIQGAHNGGFLISYDHYVSALEQFLKSVFPIEPKRGDTDAGKGVSR